MSIGTRVDGSQVDMSMGRRVDRSTGGQVDRSTVDKSME